MSDMDLTYLSDFLSTLFNIPHEDYPVEVEQDEAVVQEVAEVIEVEDNMVTEKVIGETMKDIELEMKVIMQEMSATKVQVKDRREMKVHIKERGEEPIEVKCDLHQVSPPVLMIDLNNFSPIPRDHCEKRMPRVTKKCGVEVKKLNYEQLASLAEEEGAIIINGETDRVVNESESDACTDDDVNDNGEDYAESEGLGSPLESKKCNLGNVRKVTKKCDVRIRRIDPDQLQKVGLENLAADASEKSCEQISGFLASKEDQIDYNECVGDQRITVVQGVIIINTREDSISDEEGDEEEVVENHLNMGEVKTMEYIEDRDNQTTTAGTGDETSLGSSAAVFPVHGSSAAVTPVRGFSTAVAAVKGSPLVTPFKDSSAVTPLNVGSSAVTPVRGSPSCHSVASPVSAVAANVCRQLARQIREEFITREEEMVVMDVDKEGANEAITVSDDEDFADFLKFCSREESVNVEKHNRVLEEPSDVKKKKSGKKASALKNSFKSAVKSVVNKLSVFKHKSKDEKIKTKQGEKPAEKERGVKLPKIDKNAFKDGRSVREGKRRRDIDDDQGASLPSKKLKAMSNSSHPYSDSLLLNFFNPVQHLRESAPLFKIPKLVTPQSKQAEGNDKKDRVPGVEKDHEGVRQRPRNGGLTEAMLAKMDVRNQIVKLDGKAISLRSFLHKEGIVPGASVHQFMAKDAEMAKSEQMPAWNIEVDLPMRGQQENIYEVQDSEEMRDIYHEDWEMMRRVTTDEERKRISSEAFKNPVPANPGRNLTFHGFKSTENYYRKDGMYRVYNRPNLTVGSFAIKCGVLEPLPGYKRRRRECQPNQREDQGRKITYEDLGNCMKSLFYQKFENKMKGGKLSQHQFEKFQDYLAHYKAGQEETENFLAFYSNKKAIQVDELQVDEVWDTELLLNRYRMFYGNPDPVFCDICAKRHLFSQ